ncbi:PREDICTED: inner nuclear membrane protein Man1 isoform X2 [Rhagoletis zephyria]|nr:PREDICTED: inner nuclear membrane protein Man1 isoform X2 [Rhagoletis zephyria]XP_036341455.1 inner nuclear membrane protein Man1-like isoform X2 [Rhagoletis pomonella]XP_036341482.1 inner nuclear membrane protein Man1-like isoform X2 [Rhagoletis pomonella]
MSKHDLPMTRRIYNIKSTVKEEMQTANCTEHKYNRTLKEYLPFTVSGLQHTDHLYSPTTDFILSSPETNVSNTSCKESHLGVVSRLLSFREKTFRKPKACEHNFQTLLSLPKETNKYLSKSKRTMCDFLSYISTQSLLNQSFKPCVLVGTFIVFFICLGLIYIFQSPKHLQTYNFVSQIPVCDGTFTTDDCLSPVDADIAINLIAEIEKTLKIRSKKYECNNKKTSISEAELINYMETMGHNYNVHTWRKHLIHARFLIKQNPQWNIATTDGENYKFLIVNPVFCFLVTKLQSFFVIIGIGAIIALLSGISYTIYRYIRAWRVNRSNIIEQFTTDIVNELIYRASLSETPEEREVIIIHLRDKLIPFKKRSTHLKFWKEALQILDATDSRIQFGVKNVDGEDYRTMKWIGNANGNTRANGLLKKWQSPAFDCANKIDNPPTSCLKIRHMFDSSEVNIPNLKQIIEAALIEKVGTRCCIQDIQIDKQSCCVYVRCGSEIDAGIIHNEINGWWFDKRLISIKFLRLQRYLARFPNSVGLDS